MSYNRLQKFISGLLIFSLLFSITFRFPLPNFLVSADSNEIFDLVSIIVDEDTYSKLKSEVDRYGKDVSSVLENTKTVILPISKGTTAFQIASMNESLYYEGYKAFDKSINFESKLIGTVIVGNIPLPVALQDNEIAKTVLPYTDFLDKSYIFNRETNVYEENFDNISGIEPEIWHGIVSPNTGNDDENISAIKTFFDKDHDFYTGQGFYTDVKKSINGDVSTGVPNNYEPFVFYFDAFREEQGLNYSSYIGYNGYLDNKEDIVYNRFTTDLANKLKSEMLQYSVDEVYELLSKTNPDIQNTSSGDSLGENIPDIQARYVIENATKKFLEVFSEGTMGTIRENVYNAGRYNFGQDVNVDFIPYLITVLDVVNDELMKDFSADLENEIDDLVKNGFSRNIGLPTFYTYDESREVQNGNSNSVREGKRYSIYGNYLFGKDASSVTDALECSYYRGSLYGGGQLVEASRGLDIYKTESDFTKLRTLGREEVCFQNLETGTRGYWGGVSPLNLNTSNVSANGELSLNNYNYKGAITDLYDINGAKKIDDLSKTPSPLLCLNNNYLLAYEETQVNAGLQLTYKIPDFKGSNYVGWMCTTDNYLRRYNFPLTFDKNYLLLKDYLPIGCHIKRILLDDGLTNLESYINGLKTKLKQLRTYLDEYMLDLDKYIVEFNTESTSLSGALNNSLNSVISDIDSINLQLADINDEDEDAEEKKQALIARINELNGFKSQLEDTKQQLTEIINNINIVKENVKKIDDDLNELENDLKNLETILRQKDFDHNLLSKYLDNLDKYTKESENFEKELKSLDDMLANLKSSILDSSYLDENFGDIVNKLKTPDSYSLESSINYVSYNLTSGANNLSNATTGFKGFMFGCLEGEIPVVETWEYKSIPSYVVHKSPTESDISSQVNSMVSPNLPIDKDRYIDFIAPNGNYVKINYPYLFRLQLSNEVTIEKVSEELDSLLDSKSKEINDLITSSLTAQPIELLSNDSKIKSLLSTGTYPSANFDLKAYLKNRGAKNVNINGTVKTLSYYDILAFALYWNNLPSVSSKYQFVFEHYLSSENSEKYYLPKNKSEYEISYLASFGNAQNMFVGLDPESKGENPYGDIIGANQDISAKLFGVNLGNNSNSSSDKKFKCGPPEGVPIREWIPAVMCRLEDMLPPTITIEDGNCGTSILSFLSDEEKDEFNSCNGDENKNGVNDYIEKVLPSAKVVLESDSLKYNYNKLANLKLKIVGENGNDLVLLSGVDAKFELIKLENGKGEIVYDKSRGDNKEVFNSYINFSDQTIRLNDGKANYSIGFKDKDAVAYIKATVIVLDNNKKEVINLSSDLLKLEVGSNRLFIGAQKLVENSLSQTLSSSITASEGINTFIVDNVSIDDSVATSIASSSIAKEKIIFNIGNLSGNGEFSSVSYPIVLNLYDNNDKLINSTTINNKISTYSNLFGVEKAGIYKLELVDNLGVKNLTQFTVLPGTPSRLSLNLGTTILGSGQNISTNLVTIFDKLGNVVSGEYYDLRMSVSGDGLLFADNSKKELLSTTFEGYKAFRLRSTDKLGKNDINISLLDNSGKILLNVSETIEVIDGFNVELIPESDFKVGGDNKYAFKVELKDKNGNILQDFNSRMYVNIDSNFLSLEKNYFDLVAGVGRIEFTTKTLASKNVNIELNFDGLGIISKSITILPDVPMKMDLILSENKIEADSNSYTTLQVELKDRYNNLVFNDSSTEVSLEILPKYSRVISSPSIKEKVKEGKANFKIFGTATSGIGYFKVSAPNIANNSFTIGEGEDSLTINGVGENAGIIQTFYVWNKSKIDNMQYNAIYTTLLGANYGDIDEQNYLAGELIFNKNSKALAVSSILNNPYNTNDIISVNKNSAVKTLFNSADLSQDIKSTISFSDNNGLDINLFNNSLNTYIGKIHFALPKNPSLQVCNLEIESCFSSKETSIVGKSLDSEFSFYTTGGNLSLMDNSGKTYLEINKSGQIIKKDNLDFELISQANYLGLNIKYQNKLIGVLGFNFINAQISTSRDETVFNNKINSSSNSILVYLNSILYGYRTIGKGEDLSLIIYYKDPFSSEDSLNNFSKNSLYSYENIKEQDGIGWKDGNKTLLSFSASQTAGESLKEFSSFSSVNIGDPVISLKNIRKLFNNSTELKQFDSTIGDIINKDSDLYGYKLLDYNADDRDDILLVKNNGYLELLENTKTENKFLSLGDLAYIADIGNLDNVLTGDFTGDGFSDIFFIGEDFNPYLLNNINKDFSRLSLVNKFNLGGNIVKAEVFDMDNDLKDDIVTLDDVGEINIFYGGGVSANPIFTKLLINSEYGLKLGNEVRSDAGFIYFDSLHQIDPTDYSYLIGQTQENQSVNEDFYNSVIFEQVAYSKENLYSFEDYSSEEIPTEIEQKTFIRSEYSDVVGLKVEKSFKDRNGDTMRAGEFIDVEVKITNIGTTTKNDMVYIEDVIDYIDLDTSSISNSKNLTAKSPNNAYDLLFDDFSLRPNESLIIKYSGTLKSLKYLEMQVGLFEKGEAGDDAYGDIIIKNDSKNCSTPVDIFRSIAVRTYDKGIKEPVCKGVELPEELTKNALDADNNGIPDYIDDLTKSQELQKEYSESVLKDLYTDSDNDGIPDDEDIFSFSDSLTDDLGGLTDGIEQGLDGVQSILNGLGCGFGGGACYSTPLNWAPLAPGSDPTFMGYPVGNGLMVGEGLPVFSGFTWTYYGPYCGPAVWPVSPLGAGCSMNTSAGGRLGTWDPTNQFRLYVTPTLTGGVGVAMCFGGPAITAGYSNPMGVHPFLTGGNCVVAAKPILGCSNDGSDGDPESIGIPVYGSSYGVINGNCGVGEDVSNAISTETANDYYKHITNQGTNYSSLYDIEGAIVDHSTGLSGPLFTIGSGNGEAVSISIDTSTRSIDFSDITKVVQKRISSFPSFLMNWVTRQIEEIANKLTDFPTLFIILPDFSGLYDTELTWEENKANWKANYGRNDYELADINYSGDNETLNSLSNKAQGVNSSVKDAYEFISSIPIINLRDEVVNISFPWITSSELKRAMDSRTTTISQRMDELENAKENWSFGKACDYEDEALQKQCEEENKISNNFSLDAQKLINSLKANIEVIKSYGELPEKIYELINTKEKYLEQILCNIEVISKILGGRIGANGERFKAWVELYILIKSILKSWQLLVDIFVGYEESCKECKNERNDLMTFIWELVSAVVPQIPVIEFPKWPDIILDLHNIRASLDISLPEFKLTPRPLILPNLPDLSLPDTPGLGLSLPALPILPTIDLIDLPDLPTLPTIELPDLPPPPTLPKMFASLEAILDILKLVTKVMCILKSSPFVPEWRAGDQIAFITERNGYLGLDFLSLSSPTFSFPFVDAIKVSTYVNLEVQSDFITEMARQIAMPINSLTSDVTNIFDVSIQQVDYGTSDINVDLNIDTENNIELGNTNIIKYIAYTVAGQLLSGVSHLKNYENELVSNEEFKKEISKNLASKSFTNDPQMAKFIELWNDVNNYTFSKENEIIANLEKNNEEKFSLVRDIINTEILKNRKFKEEVKDLFENSTKKVALTEDSSIELYKEKLQKYNDVTIENLSKLLNYDESKSEKTQLKNMGNDLIAKVDRAFEEYLVKDDSKLLAANIATGDNTTQTTTSSTNSCQSGTNNGYSYNYEGIYILENGKSYRLFDYKQELIGDEEITMFDFDNDGDEDILYFMNGTLYLKENFLEKSEKIYLKENPLVVNTNKNKFILGNFIEAVNGFSSYPNSNSLISVYFQSLQGIDNYRLEFYDIVDKFFNEENENYTPKLRKKQIIDAISGVGTVNLINETNLYKEAKNVVYISEVGDLRGITVTTDELKNIGDDLKNGNAVVLSSGTKVYAGDSRQVLGYLDESSGEISSLVIPKNSYIELKSTLKVVSGEGFVKTGKEIVYSGTDVRNLVGKPLFFGTEISYTGNENETVETSYIDLKYYDNTEFSLNFNYIKSWKLYDLGITGKSSYSIVTSINNDFYYAKIKGFKDEIIGTISNQILLSPQIQADNYAPELILSSIKVPVYQKKTFSLLDYIYEDSGIDNIKDIYIDFDLKTDNDGDGNPKNDNDSSSMSTLVISKGEDITLEVGTFDILMNKEISVIITDSNGNVGNNEIQFEVYSPIPEIENNNVNNFYGVLDEELTDEPVNLYRLRGGVVTKLEDSVGKEFVLSNSGAYNFIVGDGKLGVKIENNGALIAEVNEKTGKITVHNPTYIINVLESNNSGNESVYPKISLSNSTTEVFFETIRVNSSGMVKVVENFEGIESSGIYVKFLDTGNYTYNINPENVVYNPGTMAIYRNSSSILEELFVIFSDGRIRTLNQNYTLKYSTYADYVVLKLVDKHFNREVAEVLYKVESDYVIN